MSFNISAVSNTNYVRNVNFGAKAEKVNNAANVGTVELKTPEDSLEFQHKNQGRELTKRDKQQILKEARTNAAMWSILGGVFSSAYYSVRSDRTIAGEFNLDAEKDKEFIKKIRHDQFWVTTPAVFIPHGGGLIPFIYCASQKAASIDVD